MAIKGSTNMDLEGKERKEKVRLRENGSIAWWESESAQHWQILLNGQVKLRTTKMIIDYGI